MKRYKIRNIKDKEDFYYISEAFAKIFENSQIKNNQSFIRIKTLQDKEINILPAEWRIKEDGEYKHNTVVSVSDDELKE